MMPAWLGLGLGLGCAALLAACGKKQVSATESAPSNSAPPAAPESASPASPAVATGVVPSDLPACRAVRVTGEAKLGDVALTSGALLDGDEWVTLGAGASVSLKHSTSARELAIRGPALFRACRKGREQLLLARGNVVTTAGAGARPGAEVLIATPIGIVRYGDADLTVTLDGKLLEVEMRAGQANVDPVDPKKAPKGPLSAKDKLSLPVGKPKPEALVARCKEAAEAAESSARRVADKSAKEPLGERAQAHVRARKLARAACTVAAAATGLVADPELRAGLWAEVQRWEGLWETIPRPGRPVAPEK